MSQKNFASYGDMETLVTEIADKCGPYTEISYEDWLQLTPYQQEHGRWDVTGVPGADGTISIDLMTKLWENESPTATFAGQSVAVANSGNDFLMIGFNPTAASRTVYQICPAIGNSMLSISWNTGTAATGAASFRRNLTASATSVVFADGKNQYTGITDGTENAVVIPTIIYGIKLHHTVEVKAIAPTVSTLAENCVFDPTGTDLESTDVEAAIKELESNFQAGVDDIYDAVVAKGSTPASHSLSDIIAAIAAIPTGITPSGNKSITANGTNIDVTQYATVSVAVPNSNSATYTYPSGSTGGKVDLGATNSYRYVNAANVYAKGKADGDVKHTVTVQNTSGQASIKVFKDGTQISFAAYDAGESRSFTI